jgi:aminocarboxymuconate-semialdehyde decarboxylase
MPWLVGMPAETTRAICSLAFGGVLDRHPRLRLCFAHGGGSFPFTIGRIEKGFVERPDLCATKSATNPRAHLGRLWFDSLVHDAHSLRELVRIAGADRVALGSDYPFPLGEHVPGTLIRAVHEFDEATRARLLAGNAIDFLGVGASLRTETGS